MNIIIIGAGKLGKSLTKTLTEAKYNVTVVDVREDKVDTIVNKFDAQGVLGSGTHCDVLNQAGVKSADLLIATTLSDENNILSCMIAKRMGAKNTIARVRNPEYNHQIEFMRDELGITMMVNPDFSAALEISRIIQFPSAMNIESFSKGRIDMAEIKIKDTSPLAGMKISKISEKFKNKVLICAVCRQEEVFIPNGDFVINVGDKVHITGKHSDLVGMTKDFGIRKKGSGIKNVMIVGGSRITYYLTNILLSMGKNVIILEKNMQKCDFLCEQLNGATILHNDANDHELLIEDGIDKMDAVITLTDSDETNFLVSMYAKTLDIDKCVTKINNTNLAKMLDNLDQDSTINVNEITTDTIYQYVRAKKYASSNYMKSLYRLVDGKIEAIEFEAANYVKFINRPLSSIKLKKDILIAAISRKSKIIFPGGNDCVQKGDTVIIVAKKQKINDLNDILA